MRNLSFKNLICLYKNASDTSEFKLEEQIHLNIWEAQKRLFHWKTYVDYINIFNWLSILGYHSQASLDIGLKIDLRSKKELIQFILPWVITDNHVKDLSSKINDNDALRAIFNEPYIRTDNNAGAIVSSSNDDILFNIIKLSIGDEGEISIETKYFDENKKKEYSVLTLDLEKISAISKDINNKTDTIYIRFRLQNVPTSFYRVNLHPWDRIFNSATTITQIIDFRVNVQRDIPSDLSKNHITKNKYKILNFEKMHLFIMKPFGEKIIFENKHFQACRSLENEEYWAKYSGYSTHYVKKNLGYQWSNKDSNLTSDGWNVLSKFESIRLGIFTYLITILLAGAVGGILGNLAYNYFFPVTANNIIIEAQYKPYSLSTPKLSKEVTE